MMDVPQTARGTAAAAPADEQLLAARASALLRLLLLAAVFIGNRLSSHPLVETFYFNLIMAVAAAYSVLVLINTWRSREHRARQGGTLLVDLLLVSALAYCSGRGFPQIRAAFFLVPMTAAIHLGPYRTAATAAVAGVLYIVVALTHPVHNQLPVVAVLAHSLFIVWSGAAAVLMSILRVRREQRIVALSQARGLLVAQTVEAEERVRKQISAQLHDNAIQDLLTARQDLAEAQEGDQEALSRVSHAVDLVLCQLRSTIEDLDAYLLDHLDLPEALEAIASRASRHGSCGIEVDVQTSTTACYTELVASLARELLGNAAKHAGAARVRLSLTQQAGSLVLDVSDDGCGFNQEQALAALRAGHIGLAASRERVEATGGTFHVDSRPGRTRVRCVLPLDGCTHRQPPREAKPLQVGRPHPALPAGFSP
jgi:two-component system, NarL family, sensor kinase